MEIQKKSPREGGLVGKDYCHFCKWRLCFGENKFLAIMTATNIAPYLLSCLFALAAIFIGLIIECLISDRAKGQRPINIRLNVACTLISSLAQSMLDPLTVGLVALVVNGLGGGLLVLPASGWMLIPGTVLYVAAMDFAEYLFHRAQHAHPLLWSMHSLHHSDTELNASTTNRHFWGERSIKAVTVFVVPALLFKANATVLLVYVALSLCNVFFHMNVRVGFGRWSMLLNSPQYHRIHHSRLPEHYNCNFSALFPIFDVVFRTYRQPVPEEYPPTGIEMDEGPFGIVEAGLWPVRSFLRRGKSVGQSSPPNQ
jgi:sterol desaturase/sphingolipid hydroxylase (fatty acid hydroxylase superfamily)